MSAIELNRAFAAARAKRLADLDIPVPSDSVLSKQDIADILVALELRASILEYSKDGIRAMHGPSFAELQEINATLARLPILKDKLRQVAAQSA